MTNEEILNKYIYLIDNGYCSDCNELNCIDNFPHSKITHAIRELQQENKRLKDNWNKLKKWAKYERKVAVGLQNGYGTSLCDCMVNKMQELEGSGE